MIGVHNRQLREPVQHDVNIKRLQQILGNGAQFKCARAMSSWQGLAVVRVAWVVLSQQIDYNPRQI